MEEEARSPIEEAKASIEEAKASVAEVLEKILGTQSVLSIDLEDVGIVIGDRKFSFTGKLKIGPISLGASKSKKKR